MKNRIMMTPMGTNYGEQTGEMSFLHINYYEQRAKGGVGLIMVENASVDSPLGSNGTTQIRIDHDNYMPRFFKLCETVHSHGACIGLQLNHAGASAQSKRTNMQPVSASDIPSKAGGAIPRPLTKDEIYAIVKKYGEAAARAQASGFDCIEIHAGHSYLISQFLSPTTNVRTDEFGGSLFNRMRFLKLIIRNVRMKTGMEFPIIVRVSGTEMITGGREIQESKAVCQMCEDEGADAIHVSISTYGSLSYCIGSTYLASGYETAAAAEIKKAVTIPVKIGRAHV